MKYLKKKSTVQLNKTTGAISDTLNVEDTITNAPSIRLTNEMIQATQEIEDLSSQVTDINSSVTGSHISILKYGKLVVIDFWTERSGNFSDGDVLFKVPTSILSKLTINTAVAGASGTIRMTNFSTSGELKIVGTVTNTNWLCGSIRYLLVD